MIKELHIKLDNETRDALSDLAKRYDKKDEFYVNAQTLVSELKSQVDAILPNDVKKTIISMVEKEGPDLLSISNLPSDDNLPFDGELNDRIQKKSKISEYCLVGLTSLLNGTLQAEDSSHQPGLIHQITPVKTFEHESSGRGRQGLPFHVENVFIKNPPSFLSLFCLKGEENVGTEYIFLDDIIRYMSEESINQLKRPIYTVCTGDGFSDKKITNTAVIEDMGNEWTLGRFYEEDRIFTDDEEGKAAVEELHEAIVKARDNDYHSVDLESGTLLIFRNGTGKGRVGGVMHGRRGQIQSTQKSDGIRWLQRICIEIPYL